MKTYVSFEINEKFYEIEKADNGFTLTVDSNKDSNYLLPSYESALEFLLMLVEADGNEEDEEMLKRTYFEEPYEYEEVGFNPYLGCYDYDC